MAALDCNLCAQHRSEGQQGGKGGVLSVIYAAQLICGQDRGGGSVRRLPVTRSRVVPTQDLGRSTRMSACFVGPDKIARETSREREIEREGGERAGNAIKCPLPGVEIGGTWLDCGFSLPEARCWCDYCDGLRCCFIFFISYVCIIDDNDDEPDNNGDASGHGRWAAQRRRPFAYLANNNNGQRQWPNAAGSPGFSPSSGILIDECYPCSRRGTSTGYPKPCHA